MNATNCYFGKLTIVIVCVALFAARAGQAAGSTPRPGTGIVEDLRAHHVFKKNRIGDFSLDEFMRLQSSITWRFVPALPPQSPAGARKSAYYLSFPPQVVLAGDWPREAEASRPQLELHEALGALGYGDNEYELSTALEILDEKKDSPDVQTLIDLYGRTLFKKSGTLMAMAGGSSVSGGGDALAIDVKNTVLKTIMAAGQPVSMTFLSEYPAVTFEPFYDPKMQFVGLEYQYRDLHEIKDDGLLKGVQLHPSYQEVLTIYFPALAWQNVPQARGDIIANIERKILSLYPAVGTYQKSTLVPYDCDPNLRLSYPAPMDAAIETVQEFRVGLLSGCKPTDGWNMSGFSVRSPSW